jgi:multidrug transporter EmrE-like cation transporter
MSVTEIFALTLTEIAGDFSLKKYANDGGAMYLAIGIIGYIGVVVMLIISLRGSTVLFVNNAWDGMSSLFESIMAMIILGERFNTNEQYLGMIMIVFGMYLLKIPMSKRNV